MAAAVFLFRHVAFPFNRVAGQVASIRFFCHRTADKDVSSQEPYQIYKGSLTTQIKAIKTFSLGTSLLGMAMQPVLYQHLTTEEGGNSALLAAASVVGFFTIFTPFLIHMVTKKYITEIKFDPKKDLYEATIYNLIPFRKQIYFNTNDVSVPEVPGAFTSFIVKKTPLFCIPHDFTHPEHYGKLMGFDKPIDLKLGNPRSDNSEKSV